MKKLVFVLIIFITGCFDDTTEIKAYMETVQANTTRYIPPMPEVPEFNHIAYSASGERSPFILPKPEAIQESMAQVAGCLSPDPKRRKQALEKFPLGTLAMRGTLGESNKSWALIEASDNTIHKVTVGNYLGMQQGKIISVENDLIKVLELVPDGSGCWVERESVVSMMDDSSAQR